MTNGEKFKETFPDVEVDETEKGFVILKLKAKYPGKNASTEYSDSLAVWNSIWYAEYKEPSPVPIRGYICDPKKNKECAKTACYERGGLCCLTLNPKYAKEPSEEKETELDEYSHPGIISHRHEEIETCVRVPKEEHTEMHRRKNL